MNTFLSVLKSGASKLSGPAFIVAFGMILSRISGLIRIRVLSGLLGAGSELDTFYAAFRIPDFLASIMISGTLSVAFIPVFAKYMHLDRTKAIAFARHLLGITALTIGSLMAVLIIISPWLIDWLVPGFSDQQKSQVLRLTFYIGIAQIFFSISILTSSILHSFKHFTWPSFAALLYNLGIIFASLLLYKKIGLVSLGIGVLFGSILHLSVQLPHLWKHLRQNTYFSSSRESVKELWKLYLPRLAYLDIGQTSLLISTIIASKFAVGTVATYTIGYDLALAPLGILATSIVTVSYPNLSELFASGQKERFLESILHSALQILKWMYLASLALYVFRVPIIELLLGSGKFDQIAVQATAESLAGLTIGLPALGLISLLSRSFWAMHKSFWPLMGTWIAVLLYIILAFTNADNAYELGVVLSTSAWVCVAILGSTLAISLKKQHAAVAKYWRAFFKAFTKILLQPLPAAIVAFVLIHLGSWPERLTQTWWIRIILSVMTSLVFYVIMLKLPDIAFKTTEAKPEIVVDKLDL